ncbi:flagellar protein G [Methanococcoides methylutens]|uniref:Flagellar protein G n=1 Tax=Methanococcoides methylutens TaxID=2226 RepID=A0A099T2I3_METMT|nr:flagellin [Methanococcoides methylutens]KGK98378.1 flagellar protein G [Methanococcoides methylutens]
MAFLKSSDTHCFIKDRKAETAITHMIFFIAAILIAMTVIAVMSANVQSLTGATASSSKVLSEQIKTDITIISDPKIIPYDSTSKEYTFYAKNTGRTDLDTEYLDVFIDGLHVDPENIEMEFFDQDVLWRPGDTLVVNMKVTDEMTTGDHRILIATENGKSDSMDFRI